MATYKTYYLEFKPEFFNFARGYTSDVEIIADSYHDAFIILHDNIVQQKLTQLSSSLKTYVFSIGKYSLLAKLRKHGKEVLDGDMQNIEIANEVIDEPDPRIRLVADHLDKLGGSCKRLVILFYYRKLSIAEIVRELKYKNENSVKAHKSRCMKQLRQSISSS